MAVETKEELEARLKLRQDLMSPNAVADRYPSIRMLRNFSPVQRVIDERELWIAVMTGQSKLGLDITPNQIAAYESVKDQVDLESIRLREIENRHSEKAKLEEFDDLAGGLGKSHLGMTSRDLTDNIEQVQIRNGLTVIIDKSVAALARHAKHASENEMVAYADRTHNAIAQPSLVGKIFSNFGEEMIEAFHDLEGFVDRYPLRGLKGATGTQTDQIQLLKDPAKAEVLDRMVADHLGFKRILNSVGQIYPRSLDFAAISRLFQLIAGPANTALTFRLMAGQDQFTEGFSEHQSGSTAMAYKMNTRTLERVAALQNVIGGHLDMAKSITGKQWYSGDVSESATRRVAVSDSLFATDGLFEAYLTALDECGFYPAVMSKEIDRYLPFLTSTKFMMMAVEKGVPRELAHRALKKHSTDLIKEMREQGTQVNDLVDRLAKDGTMKLDRQEMLDAMATPMEYIGNAPSQIKTFLGEVQKIVDKYPEAAKYEPEPIL